MTSMIADKTRAGLMGPNHVRRLERVEGIVKDPTAFTDVQPTLDYDLRNINGAPFVGNLTRATVGGYRMNTKGVLVPTVANEPNIDFGVDSKGIGTGFWGAYTNLLLRSEEFDNGSWSKSSITVGANAIAAPDGNTTADSLTRSSASGGNVQQAISSAIGTTVTASIFAKAKATGNRLGMRLQGSYPNRADAIFDLSTGAVISSAGSTYTGVSAQIEDHGNGWYRCSLTTTIVTSALATLVFGPCDSSHSVGGWEGASATLSDCYAWGAQITATAFPVPYVPTTSATAVRNADSMVISGTDFTDFYNPTEGTFFADVVAPIGSGARTILQVDDTTFNNRHAFFTQPASNIIVYRSIVGGVNQCSIQPSLIAGANAKVAYSYTSNLFNLAVNGVLGPTDTSGSVPTGLTRLLIGNDSLAGDELSSHIRRVVYFPKALDAATLQRMTA